MHKTGSSGDSTLTCCNETFPDKGSYRLHAKVVHKNGHECQTCRRIFTRRALLRRHQSVHTGVKEFKCHLCTYATSHKSNLERHFKIHVNGRLTGYIRRPKPDNVISHRNLVSSSWLKRRGQIGGAGGGLHPRASVSTAMMKNQFHQRNQTSKSTLNRSPNGFTSSHVQLNSSRLSHSIESILSRPIEISPCIMKSSELPGTTKNETRTSCSKSNEQYVQEAIQKNQISSMGLPQLKSPSTGLTSALHVNDTTPYFAHPQVGHMSSILAFMPQFQPTNVSTTMFMNQGQDLRLHFDFYNNYYSRGQVSPSYKGFNNATSLFSPQYNNYAACGVNYPNWNLDAYSLVRDVNGALPYFVNYNNMVQLEHLSQQSHHNLDFMPPQFQLQQSQAELMMKQEQAKKALKARSALLSTVEEKEPSLTCCNNTSAAAPNNASLTNFTTPTTPSAMKAVLKNEIGKRGSTSCTSTKTTTAVNPVNNLTRHNSNSCNHLKRRNAQIYKLDDSASKGDRSITVPDVDVDNCHVPLKKRRHNGR